VEKNRASRGSGVSEKFRFASERRGFCDEMLASFEGDVSLQIGPAVWDALDGWMCFGFEQFGLGRVVTLSAQ
jgi:hypothetical protein